VVPMLLLTLVFTGFVSSVLLGYQFRIFLTDYQNPKKLTSENDHTEVRDVILKIHNSLFEQPDLWKWERDGIISHVHSDIQIQFTTRDYTLIRGVLSISDLNKSEKDMLIEAASFFQLNKIENIIDYDPVSVDFFKEVERKEKNKAFKKGERLGRSLVLEKGKVSNIRP